MYTLTKTQRAVISILVVGNHTPYWKRYKRILSLGTYGEDDRVFLNEDRIRCRDIILKGLGDVPISELKPDESIVTTEWISELSKGFSKNDYVIGMDMAKDTDYSTFKREYSGTWEHLT